ncbi:MAG TPA: hypothetical protein VN806_07890 [Caulobacteraceae bacterium]|nr:hypothetical protein [Caulobacteraceae bacterium]
MNEICAALASPAALLALLASAAWAPITGVPTWPTLSHGRLCGTVTISGLVGCTAFAALRRLAVSAGS